MRESSGYCEGNIGPFFSVWIENFVYVLRDAWKVKKHKANLHNPIENIVKIEINVDCQRLAYLQGLAYGFGNSSVYFYVLENKNSPNIDIKILVPRKKSLMLLQHFLPKEQLLNVIESFWTIKKTYKNKTKE